MYKISDLWSTLSNQEERKLNPKLTFKKEFLKIRVEINEIENMSKEETKVKGGSLKRSIQLI